MNTCMHPSFLPFSHSLSSTQMQRVKVACSVIGAGRKDGQDEKVSQIGVCGLLRNECSMSEVHVCSVSFESMFVCVCRGSDREQTCIAQPRIYKTLPLGSLPFLLHHRVASVCLFLSSRCGQWVFSSSLFSLSYRCFLFTQRPKLSLYRFPSPLHLLLFPFVHQRGVSRESRALDLSLWIWASELSERWACWGSVWAMLGTASYRDCSSVLLCFGCWNGRMVGLYRCMLACCFLTVTHHWSLLSSLAVVTVHLPSSIHWIKYHFLLTCI